MKNEDKLKYHYQKLIFDDLPKNIKYGVFIAGGAVRDYLTDSEINDIDLFVTDQGVLDNLIAFFKEKGKLINENKILANYKYKDKWFQIIKNRFFESPRQLIDSFDFTICQAVVYVENISVNEGETKDQMEFEFNETFFQDSLAKHLRTATINFPLSTLERMQKYIKKGYTACNGTLLNVAKAIHATDINDPNNNNLFFYPDGSARFVGVD
jgi:hypothetical protein